MESSSPSTAFESEVAPPTLPKPIMFSISGLVHDTALQVFDQEFRVHSSVLKLHSTFFRKFLDSPDKTPRSGGIEYKWSTQIDEDGTWSLIGEMNPAFLPSNDFSTYKGNKEQQIKTFEKLISSIYGRPFLIESTQEIALLTELADYYCALPAVSRTLTNSFFRSPKFTDTIANNATELLRLSIKLRNDVLFRDCIIHVLTPWHAPTFVDFKDRELKKIASIIYNGFCAKLIKIKSEIILDAASTKELQNIVNASQSMGIRHQPELHFSIPLFLREIHTRACHYGLSKAVEPFLRCYLTFNRDGRVAGVGKDCDDFLCIEVLEEDLPWDTTKQDW